MHATAISTMPEARTNGAQPRPELSPDPATNREVFRRWANLTCALYRVVDEAKALLEIIPEEGGIGDDPHRKWEDVAADVTGARHVCSTIAGALELAEPAEVEDMVDALTGRTKAR